MWLFASVPLSVCLYRAGTQKPYLGAPGKVKNEWTNLTLIALETLHGGLNLDQ